MLGLFRFKCEECGNMVKKINKVSDLFDLKLKRKIVCKHCGLEYKIPEKIIKIYNFIYYVILGPCLVLLCVILSFFIIDKAEYYFNIKLGYWAIVISLLVCLFIHFVIELALPLKKIHNKE